jgi:hypothetical protein
MKGSWVYLLSIMPVQKGVCHEVGVGGGGGGAFAKSERAPGMCVYVCGHGALRILANLNDRGPTKSVSYRTPPPPPLGTLHE